MKMTISAISVLAVLCGAVIDSRCVAAEPSAAPADTFSFVVLPDTQGYVSEKSASYFESEVNWILENRERQKIAFVSHVGDIVDEYESDAQWDVARRNMLRLADKLPFGFSVGNHDMRSEGDSRKFQESFPASLCEKQPWYG